MNIRKSLIAGAAVVASLAALIALTNHYSGSSPSLMAHSADAYYVDSSGASNKAAASAPIASNAIPKGRSAGNSGGFGPTDSADSPKLTLASLADSNRDRFLVKNGSVTLEVSDVPGVDRQIKAIIASLQGYVGTSHASVDGLGLKNEALEVRVPAHSFDDTMGRLLPLGRVLDNAVTTEDVTESYVDSDAELKSLHATESRLLEHLSRTGRLSDTLLVEKELTRVRGEANELEGKLRLMSHQITFSTITITLKEPGHPEPITPTESFSAGQVASSAMRSFVSYAQMAIAGLIWIAVWSIVWAPMTLLARALWLRHRGGALTGR